MQPTQPENSLSPLRSAAPLPRHTAMLISPWLLAGSTLILALAIAFWAFKNARQERENMDANLQARAGALMWAVEGSARAGMGMMRTASYMQFMLEEISRQPDIEYIAVITPDGTVMAHSNPERIGQKLYQGKDMAGLLPYQQIHWRIKRSPTGLKVFEAYRRFVPLPGFLNPRRTHNARPGMHPPGMPHMSRMAREPGSMPPQPPLQPGPPMQPGPPLQPGQLLQPGQPFQLAPPPSADRPPTDSSAPLPAPPPQPAPQSAPQAKPLPAPPPAPPGFGPAPGAAGNAQPKTPGEPIIVIGLDMSSQETHLTTAERNTLFTALLVGLLGAGAFLSLFWAQNYKMSRRMLMDARAFTDEVIASMPLGLVIFDSSGRVAQANALAGRLLGRPPAALLGLAPLDMPGCNWQNIAERAARGEAVLEEEYDLACAGSLNAEYDPQSPEHDPEISPMPVSVSASRIINEEDRNLGILVLLRDMREVKRLQAELRRSERLSTLGNMAARVAHEIRNPLSSIKGFATYLGERQNTEDDRSAAKTMIGEVDRLNRVVSELLDFARPSNLQLAPAQVTDLLQRAARLARMDADTKGVTIVLPSTAPAAASAPSVPPAPPASPSSSTPPASSTSSTSPAPPAPPTSPGEPLLVNVDAERITQALLNLLLNAVQATDAGGTVTVSVSQGKNTVSIRIADTGRGMEPDVLAQVFNPYFTTKASGTGLGLSIVAKIVEDHHGDITMTSTPGQGATVTLRLPAARVSA